MSEEQVNTNEPEQESQQNLSVLERILLDYISVVDNFIPIADMAKYNIFVLAESVVFHSLMHRGMDIKDAVRTTSEVLDAFHVNNYNKSKKVENKVE